jgi:hypothetical protein
MADPLGRRHRRGPRTAEALKPYTYGCKRPTFHDEYCRRLAACTSSTRPDGVARSTSVMVHDGVARRRAHLRDRFADGDRTFNMVGSQREVVERHGRPRARRSSRPAHARVPEPVHRHRPSGGAEASTSLTRRHAQRLRDGCSPRCAAGDDVVDVREDEDGGRRTAVKPTHTARSATASYYNGHGKASGSLAYYGSAEAAVTPRRRSRPTSSSADLADGRSTLHDQIRTKSTSSTRSST